MLLQCRPTLAHTLSLSLCLSATLPFSLSFKRCCDTTNGINRNTDFSLSSSYHFKGYTYTKVLNGIFLLGVNFKFLHLTFKFSEQFMLYNVVICFNLWLPEGLRDPQNWDYLKILNLRL